MATFGRYTLIRRVGLGGMAEIWKAKVLGPAGFEKTVAVKKILPELTDDAEFLEMFVDEAKLVADLVHPNIVQVHDFGQVGSRDYFIAMEYVSGANVGSLLKRLRDRGARVPRETAIFIVLEAARGLGYAHARRDSAGRPLGIVHRDVSPSNILVSFGGEVKVADFGIAKAASARQTTAEGFVRGKVSYMSPEQAAGGGLDQRSDIFSLGLVFAEMLTGKRFFTGENSREIYQKVSNHREVTAADLPGVPADLVPVITRMLHPDRERRQQQAVEVEASLGALLGPEGQMLARHGLSSILQASFAEEIALELTPSGGVERPPPAPPRESRLPPATPGRPSPSGKGGVQESTVVSPPSTGAAASARETVVNEPALEDRETVRSGDVQAETVAGAPPLRDTVIGRGPQEGSGEGDSQPTFPKSKPGAVGDVTVIGGDPDAAGSGAPTSLLAGLFPGGRPSWQVYAIAGGAIGAALLGYLVVSVASIPPAVPPTPVPTVTLAIAPTPPSTPIVTSTPPVVATPAATPATIPTATPTARPPATPRATPRVAVVQYGSLSVNARPWVEVWVDGKQISRETPLNGRRIPAGAHELTFVNSAAGFRLSRRVVVPANGEVNLFVDVKARTAQIRH